jgi:hypothetical protein
MKRGHGCAWVFSAPEAGELRATGNFCRLRPKTGMRGPEGALIPMWIPALTRPSMVGEPRPALPHDDPLTPEV